MSESESTVTLELLKRQLADAKRDAPLKSGGGGGTSSGMDNERLAKLEGAFDGLRHNQTVMFSVIGVVAALLLALGTYTLSKLDTLNSRIAELPGKISADFRDINRTLSEAITASKGPSVVVIPGNVTATGAPPPPQQPEQKAQ